MQENNFEKEVKQRLQNLQLQPTPPLWEAVAARIKPERRRRRLVLWWLPVAAIFMLGGWWWINGQNKSGKAVVHTKQSTGSSGSSSTKQNPAVSNTTTVSNAPEPGRARTHPFTTTTIKTKKQTQNRTVLNKQSLNTLPGIHVNQFVQASGKIKKTIAKEIVDDTEPAKSSAATRPVENDLLHGENLPADSKPAATEMQLSLAESNHIEKKEEPLPDNPAAQPQKKVKHKGRFFVQAGAGLSASGTPVFSSGKTAEAQITNSPVFAAQQYMGPRSNMVVPPVYRSGLAVNAAVGWEQPLTSRTSISLGFTYRYNSLAVQSGIRGDSAVIVRNNGIQDATNPTRNNYRSVYHLIEFPVQFRYQPLRKKDIWLYQGVGPAFTAAYKAVAFNNSIVNVKEVQWVGTSGINMGIRLSAQQKLYIGPSVRYHFNPILNQSNRHLTEAMLLLTLPIHLKK